MDLIVLVIQTFLSRFSAFVQMYNPMKIYKLTNSENVTAITETSLQPEKVREDNSKLSVHSCLITMKYRQTLMLSAYCQL